MADLFESKVGPLILRSFLEAKKGAEEGRKSAANDRLSIYHDSWQDILERVLASQFNPKNYKKIKLLKNTTQNILKKVVNDVSVIYSTAPRRSFGDGNPTAEKLYEDLQIDEFMKKVNQYANLLYDLGIRVGWDFEKKRITLNINTPANTSIIQRENHPEEAACVFYEIEYIDTKFSAEKKYIFWSETEHFIFDDQLNIYPPAPDNLEKINPLNPQVIPFAFIHLNQIPDCFWNPNAGEDLVEGTIKTGMKRTLKDYLFKFQSFKQIWLRSQNTEDIAPELLSDPASAFLLNGEGSEIGALDLTADFAGMEKSLQADINAFLGTYGLSIDMFTVAPNEASGRALTIKNRGLREIREKQLPAFRRLESDIFNLIRTVWNTYSGKAQIPDALEFKIDFSEMEIFVDPMEKRAQAQSDLKDGLISPGQFYMLFNPDITNEEEAEKAITENLAKLKKIKGGAGIFNLQNLFGESVNKTDETDEGGKTDEIPGNKKPFPPAKGKE